MIKTRRNRIFVKDILWTGKQRENSNQLRKDDIMTQYEAKWRKASLVIECTSEGGSLWVCVCVRVCLFVQIMKKWIIWQKKWRKSRERRSRRELKTKIAIDVKRDKWAVMKMIDMHWKINAKIESTWQKSMMEVEKKAVERRVVGRERERDLTSAQVKVSAVA